MIVYGSNLSPYVRKVLVVAAEKGLVVENKPFGPGIAPTPEFLQASPFAKIPALRDGDFTLSDSTAISFYLDAAHPEPRLLPDDPQARGRVMWFDEMADTLMFPTVVKSFFNRIVGPLLGQPHDVAVAERAEAEETPQRLAYLEGVAPEGEGWLVGDRFTLADVAVGSVLVNLELACGRLAEDRFPRLAAYLDRVHARPSFAPVLAKNRAMIAKVRDRLKLAA